MLQSGGAGSSGVGSALAWPFVANGRRNWLFRWGDGGERIAKHPDHRGVNQDSCLKNHHRTGDAIGLTRTSCLMGFKYTAPTGDQLRVSPVQRRGVRRRAFV